MQNSLQQVNSTSRTITTSSITTVQSLHKNQTRIWMHNMGSHHLPKKYMKQLEDTQREALSLILRTMKSTPLEAMESEMATTPIDLRIEELRRYEAIKLYQNQDSYLSHKIKSYDLTYSKQSPCKHLQKILKQLLTQIKQKNCDDINKLQLPSVKPTNI